MNSWAIPILYDACNGTTQMSFKMNTRTIPSFYDKVSMFLPRICDVISADYDVSPSCRFSHRTAHLFFTVIVRTIYILYNKDLQDGTVYAINLVETQ